MVRTTITHYSIYDIPDNIHDICCYWSDDQVYPNLWRIANRSSNRGKLINIELNETLEEIETVSKFLVVDDNQTFIKDHQTLRDYFERLRVIKCAEKNLRSAVRIAIASGMTRKKVLETVQLFASNVDD